MTEIFATETMAELCVRQGRVADAAAIYRALLERLGGVAEAGDGRRAKWMTRLAQLQGIERAPPSSPSASPAWAGTPGGAAVGGSQRSGSATRPHGGSADDRTRRALETMAAQIGADDAPAPRPARAAVALAAADTASLAPAPRPESSDPPPKGPAAPPHPAASSTGREMATPGAAPPGGAPALRLPVLIQHPVRSGQIVYAEGTDLIVLASVNAGAQLLADGNIHVYGVLRGRAIAGVKGASGARIFCQRLEAELVGIDVHFITAEGLPTDVAGKAAQIFIDRGQCVAVRM